MGATSPLPSNKMVGNTDEDATAPDDTRDIFPFLDLPREIRDIIYDDCEGDSIKLPETERDGLHLAISHPPLLQVQLVNRQIKSEYMDIASKKPTMRLSDRGKCSLSLPDIKHCKLKSIRQADVRIIAQCQACLAKKRRPCRVVGELKDTIKLIQKLFACQQVPTLETVDLSIGLWKGQGMSTFQWPESPHTNGALQYFEELANLEGVDKIEIYWLGYGELNLCERPAMEDVWVTWTEASGWKKHDEGASSAIGQTGS